MFPHCRSDVDLLVLAPRLASAPVPVVEGPGRLYTDYSTSDRTQVQHPFSPSSKWGTISLPGNQRHGTWRDCNCGTNCTPTTSLPCQAPTTCHQEVHYAWISLYHLISKTVILFQLHFPKLVILFISSLTLFHISLPSQIFLVFQLVKDNNRKHILGILNLVLRGILQYKQTSPLILSLLLLRTDIANLFLFLLEFYNLKVSIKPNQSKHDSPKNLV